MNPFKIALFADSAPQWFERALTRELTARGIAADIRSWAFTSPFAVRDELDAFAPDTLFFWAAAEAGRFPEVAPLLQLPWPVIACTMVTLDDGSCGNLALTRPDTLRSRILLWNAGLIRLAQSDPNLTLVDLDLIQSRLGRAAAFDARLWESAAMALTPAAVDAFARRSADLIAARRGQLHKVLVTDLDGTLWDGIVSETGAEGINPAAPGFPRYRAWLKTLADRGILLAVASHNDREVALAGLARPDLGLTSGDFSVIEADWGPKAAMMERIAAALHVGTDALVFLDDRAEEREAVRTAHPEIAVPELPADPALRPEFLAELNLFETPAITDDDRLRAQTLRDDAGRREASAALSPEDYIVSLNQELIPEPLTPANAARAAQLTQRCNQFNMRGTRHTEAELLGKRGWLYRVKDRFGDLGLVSAVILEDGFIETWVMSCRALNRGLEAQILAHLQSQGPVCGEYIPTERNGRCAGLYAENNIPRELPDVPTL